MTVFMLPLFNIIGYIISQIKIAMGIDTFAYSKRSKNSEIPDKNLPINTPANIHKIII